MAAAISRAFMAGALSNEMPWSLGICRPAGWCCAAQGRRAPQVASHINCGVWPSFHSRGRCSAVHMAVPPSYLLELLQLGVQVPAAVAIPEEGHVACGSGAVTEAEADAQGYIT